MPRIPSSEFACVDFDALRVSEPSTDAALAGLVVPSIGTGVAHKKSPMQALKSACWVLKTSIVPILTNLVSVVRVFEIRFTERRCNVVRLVFCIRRTACFHPVVGATNQIVAAAAPAEFGAIVRFVTLGVYEVD